MKTNMFAACCHSLLVSTVWAQAPAADPLAYNLLFVPSYEYLNTMAMSENNKEYYSVFIMAYQNKGQADQILNDEYEIVTSKGEKHKTGWHPLVHKNIESSRKFDAVSGKVKRIKPGETKYAIAIFDQISDQTPEFKLYISGLPGLDGQPNKFQIVGEFEHLKQTVVKDPTTERDRTIVWEKDPDPQFKNRYIGRWRMKRLYKAPVP